MPAPIPGELWPKLDVLGVNKVREQLAMKVYGQAEASLIEEWLQQKEREEAERRIPKSRSQNWSLANFKRLVNYIKNYLAVSVIVAFGVIVVLDGNVDRRSGQRPLDHGENLRRIPALEQSQQTPDQITESSNNTTPIKQNIFLSWPTASNWPTPLQVEHSASSLTPGITPLG